MIPHGPWRIVKSREVYSDPWLRVQCDDVIRPDGEPSTHSVVSIKPGVCVLAVDDENRVYLTEEFHYGVGRITLEAVSGGIEEDEQPVDAARRELKQELGIDAGEFIEFGYVDPFTTSVVSPTRLFVARGLTFGERSPEGTEQIQCVTLPLADAVQKVLKSEITHAPSSVLILKLAMSQC